MTANQQWLLSAGDKTPPTPVLGNQYTTFSLVGTSQDEATLATPTGYWSRLVSMLASHTDAFGASVLHTQDTGFKCGAGAKASFTGQVPSLLDAGVIGVAYAPSLPVNSADFVIRGWVRIPETVLPPPAPEFDTFNPPLRVGTRIEAVLGCVLLSAVPGEGQRSFAVAVQVAHDADGNQIRQVVTSPQHDLDPNPRFTGIPGPDYLLEISRVGGIIRAFCNGILVRAWPASTVMLPASIINGAFQYVVFTGQAGYSQSPITAPNQVLDANASITMAQFFASTVAGAGNVAPYNPATIPCFY